MAKASVIIPVYNVEKYLPQCLESVVNQTLQDIEIICVNDGSTDGSLKVLEDYAQKDSRIRIINQDNQGQGVARNNALKIAEGEYIAFVDSDDWLETDALEKLYEFAKTCNAEAVVFDFVEFDEKSEKEKFESFGEKIKKRYHYDLTEKEYFNWKDLKKHCLINLTDAAWHKIYSRDFLIKNDIKFGIERYNEDDIFSQSVLLKANKIHYLNKYLYFYRERIDSSVNRITAERLKIFKSIEQSEKLISDLGLDKVLALELSEYKIRELANAYIRLPEDFRDKFINETTQNLSDKELREFYKKIKSDNSFWENIFSIRNLKQKGKKVKVVTLFGLQYRLSKDEGGKRCY